MSLEEDIAEKVKTVKRNNGPKPIPSMPGPTTEEIEAGLLAWRRTQVENEALRSQLAAVKAQKDEMVGVLKSLASILVTYQNSLTE